MPAARLMGIINCTPDSFSDGGELATPQSAIARGEALIQEGAEILDVGGESTRPGAEPVALEEEWSRIAAVVAALAKKFTVSVDTTKAEIARRALSEGAQIINDISAGTRDSAMLATVAAARATFIAMHSRGSPASMQRDYTPYSDVVAEVRATLVAHVTSARAAGVREVWVDPGLGFGKSAADNWALVRELAQFAALGDGLVFAASRKRFLRSLAAEPVSHIVLDELTSHLTTAAVLAGASVVRVHTPKTNLSALAVADAILRLR